jgi:hypothetical protein
VLQQGHFLLQILGVVIESVLTDHILSVVKLAFHIFEVMELGMSHNLSGVIKEDPTAAVAQQVAKSIFGAVVNPPFDEDFVFNLALVLLLRIGDALELEIIHRLGG